MALKPTSSSTLSPGDFSQLNDCTNRMEQAVQEIDAASVAYGLAEAEIEGASDTRKTILAIAAAPFSGESVASAENKARVTTQYQTLFAAWKADFAAAKTTVAQFHNLRNKWETERSRASGERVLATL